MVMGCFVGREVDQKSSLWPLRQEGCGSNPKRNRGLLGDKAAHPYLTIVLFLRAPEFSSTLTVNRRQTLSRFIVSAGCMKNHRHVTSISRQRIGSVILNLHRQRCPPPIHSNRLEYRDFGVAVDLPLPLQQTAAPIQLPRRSTRQYNALFGWGFQKESNRKSYPLEMMLIADFMTTGRCHP